MLKTIKGEVMTKRESDANLLLIDIYDQISKYFSSNNKVKTVTKKKRKIKPATNPVLHKDKFAKCKYCNGDEFFWGETEWGWRLFDKDNDQHMCKDKSESKNGQSTSG